MHAIVTTAGTEWHVDDTGPFGPTLIVEDKHRSIEFELCWADLRVIADRIMQALADAGEAQPVEVISSDALRLATTPRGAA